MRLQVEVESMEQAAGLYLMQLLTRSEIEIKEFDMQYYDNNPTPTGRKIVITPPKYVREFFVFEHYKKTMALINRIKRRESINDNFLQTYLDNDFDKMIVLQILIFAVRGDYYDKSSVIDWLAKIDEPRMTAEFLAETKNIDSDQDFEL